MNVLKSEKYSLNKKNLADGRALLSDNCLILMTGRLLLLFLIRSTVVYWTSLNLGMKGKIGARQDVH